MQLTDPQKDSVRQWAAAGASLSEIQTRLADELGLRMSFMDVRLLVLDLQVAIREKRSAEPPKPQAPVTADKPAEDDTPAGDDLDEEELSPEELAELDALEKAEPAPAAKGGVTVEVSRLAQPGLALTGDVTFSDGVKAHWGITNRGELSLSAPDPAYRPTPEDVRDFQVKLRSLLSRQGY
jgi:hypothetical protein